METVRIVGLVGSSISLELGEGTNILGRSNAALGIVDGGVSRRHASIVVNSDLGTVTLNSLSPNPTYVIDPECRKKTQVSPGEPFKLLHGHQIELNEIARFRVEILDADPKTSQDLISTQEATESESDSTPTKNLNRHDWSPAASRAPQSSPSPAPVRSQTDPIQVQPNDFHFVKMIQSGEYSEVWLATIFNKPVTVKRVFQSRIEADATVGFRKESHLMSSLFHPNIVSFYGSIIDSSRNMCIVSEYVDRGSVYDALRSNEIKWIPSLRMSVLAQAARGVEYLHEQSIIHRNLKTKNLLLTSDFIVKVADFGLAKIYNSIPLKTMCGTLAWVAPEVFSGQGYDMRADVFSFAMLIFEVLTHSEPHIGLQPKEILKLFEERQRPNPPEEVKNDPANKNIIQIMIQCWRSDPEKRPKMKEVAVQIEEAAKEAALSGH